MLEHNRKNSNGTLVGCYKCNHIWIARNFEYQNTPVCPLCHVKSNYVTVIKNFLDPALHITKIQVITFGKSTVYGKRPRFYTDVEVVNYPRDRVLLALENVGFTYNDCKGSCIEYTDKLGNIVLFNSDLKRVNTEVYILQYDEDSTLSQLLVEKNKEEKAYRKTLPFPEVKKPVHIDMKDALGNAVHISDWVAYWATKNLGFGRVEDIDKILDPTQWSSTTIKVPAVRVRRGKSGILSPYKVSEQIYLLPEATAMILMLEQ